MLRPGDATAGSRPDLHVPATSVAFVVEVILILFVCKKNDENEINFCEFISCLDELET